MLIKIAPFGGLIPRMGKRLLPDTAATVANNIKLQSGEMRPLRGAGSTYTPATPKTGLQQSIFKARNGTTSNEWFSWPGDVDCVRVPLGTDVTSRFCWTGDGVPRIVTYTNAVAGGGNNYPVETNAYALGVPAPTTAATVAPSGTTGSIVTRFYCYTFVSQYGEESAPSPISAEASGASGATWAVSGMQAVPLNTGTVSSTTRSGNTITAVTSAYNWLRVGDTVTVAGVGTMTEANGTFTVTAVASDGLSFSYLVTAAATGTPGTAGTWTRPTGTEWNVSGMYRRLYRTTGSTGDWQLVSEYVSTDPLYAGWASATAFNDTYSDVQIAGDELITEGWVPPPVGLAGLCVHPSGALLGFVNNLLCMSEPLQPHAWPEQYQLSAGYNAIGLATFGTSVVMATQGVPFVATGVEPASMTGEDVQGMYPCLAKSSVIGVGDGVLYASKHGLVQVGVRGVSVFTDPWYSRDEWETLNPETMICAYANGRVYASYENDSAVRAMLIFDGQLHTTAAVEAQEMYSDVSTGELYITTADGIHLWDDSTEVVLAASWTSKDFVFPQPINIGAGKVDFDTAIDETSRAAILALIAAIEASNVSLLNACDPHTISAVDTGTETLTTSTAHGLVAGARVQFTNSGGALPTGLSAATDYYVISAGLTSTAFRVSATYGGAAVNLTGAGSGTNTVLWKDASVGGSIAKATFGGMGYGMSNIQTPPDTPAENTVEITLYANDRLVASRTVTSTRAFRWPSGYKADTYKVMVTSQCAIKEIRLAETSDGLRAA